MSEPTKKERMRRGLLEKLATRHSHAEIADFYQCKVCAEKTLEWQHERLKMGLKDSGTYLRWNKPELEVKQRVYQGGCFFCKEPVYASEGQKFKTLKLRHPITKEIKGPFPVHKQCRQANRDTKIPVFAFP